MLLPQSETCYMIRYPGGKTKLLSHILRKIKADNLQYREPFFGAGSVGIEYMKSSSTPSVFKKGAISHWLNDFDPAMFALWKSVRDFPESLKDSVSSVKPSVDLFFKLKERLASSNKPEDEAQTVSMATDKITIHQISYSGLGMKSGSPLGGKSQSSKYDVGCRWNAKSICRKIDNLHLLFEKKNVQVTCLDFEDVIRKEGGAFIYLDPPYWEKGEELYQFFFKRKDHERMAVALKESKNKWLLSYDDHPEIRKLYSFAHIEDVPLKYSINGSTVKNELLIFPNKSL